MCVYKQMVYVYTYHFTGDCYKFLAHFGGPFFFPTWCRSWFLDFQQEPSLDHKDLDKGRCLCNFSSVQASEFQNCNFLAIGQEPSSLIKKIQLMFFFNRLLMFEAGWNEELSSFKKCQQPKCLNPAWNWSTVYFLSALGKRWHLK